jgi:hypothetical protein
MDGQVHQANLFGILLFILVMEEIFFGKLVISQVKVIQLNFLLNN